MDIDKWTAGKCQVLIHNYVNFQPKSWEHRNSKAVGFGEWTMQDARCRELVREHFGISTASMGSCGLWGWAVPRKGIQDESLHYECLKDAEIACIEAIMKADDN